MEPVAVLLWALWVAGAPSQGPAPAPVAYFQTFEECDATRKVIETYLATYHRMHCIQGRYVLPLKR